MYTTLSDHYREKFGCKVYKLAIDAGFSCPNRDGTWKNGTSRAVPYGGNRTWRMDCRGRRHDAPTGTHDTAEGGACDAPVGTHDTTNGTHDAPRGMGRRGAVPYNEWIVPPRRCVENNGSAPRDAGRIFVYQ